METYSDSFSKFHQLKNMTFLAHYRFVTFKEEAIEAVAQKCFCDMVFTPVTLLFTVYTALQTPVCRNHPLKIWF